MRAPRNRHDEAWEGFVMVARENRIAILMSLGVALMILGLSAFEYFAKVAN